MNPNEQRIATQLLRLAADAWADGAVTSAERLTAGAWQIVDGQEYVDTEHDADTGGTR